MEDHDLLIIVADLSRNDEHSCSLGEIKAAAVERGLTPTLPADHDLLYALRRLEMVGHLSVRIRDDHTIFGYGPTQAGELHLWPPLKPQSRQRASVLSG